jgi:2-dehydro-3-deoxygalactonokinase
MDHFNQKTWVGLDWGTTHRRAYALDAAGTCLREYADDEGALACKGRFGSALQTALIHLHVAPGPVVMSGMVGSALGWQEVPYVNGDVPLNELAQHVRLLTDAPPGAAWMIVPGYCIRDATGQPDVMRGEETQLLGAMTLGHDTGWFVLPGTHSKWVELKKGKVIGLRTYMTGELYDLLRRNGTIAAAAGTTPPAWDDHAFSDGVQASCQGALSHRLFGCRARVVCADMPATSTPSYLSGLLIGSELNDVLMSSKDAEVPHSFKLIGSPELATHYRAAASLLNIQFELLDAKAAFLGAMAHIHTHRKPL